MVVARVLRVSQVDSTSVDNPSLERTSMAILIMIETLAPIMSGHLGASLSRGLSMA